MRVLVTWGSKHGGTEGIGRIVADTLAARGHDVVACSADEVKALDTFEAVVVGGALYANRWPPNVRRFVLRNARRLRRVPVWFFSSGPLDDSADRQEMPPGDEVAALAERVGAKRHVTFGGRLDPNVKGFMAASMAKKVSGDFRNPERIRRWADELASELPTATPGRAVDHPARSIGRLVAHGVVGWALTALALVPLLRAGSVTAALVLHAVAAPLIFVAVSRHYFRARGPRTPLPTALAFTAIVALLDLAVVAGAMERSAWLFARVSGTWLPYALILLATWATGSLMATLPWTDARGEAERRAPAS